MIDVLEPLAQLPGVLLAALVSSDGVPVAVPGSRTRGEDHGPSADPEALAALSAAWLDELSSSVALLSCDSPRRVVLRAARGTLLLLRTSGAVLLVMLEAGLGPDALWLPMEGVAARIQRILRGMGEPSVSDAEPPGALPGWASTDDCEPPTTGVELGREGQDSAGM